MCGSEVMSRIRQVGPVALTSVVLVSNYCTIIVLVLFIMSVNNNSFS